ncbi:MAG: hypothetical protein UY07_C0051G0006 [Parcubacteria group bacterium GW2011_GWA1_47_8]|nr:MAG: hypothetical protein UY07_C0051G0006 [Parcubacteria group bacterium GW2011_GWA1_47_8]
MAENRGMNAVNKNQSIKGVFKWIGVLISSLVLYFISLLFLFWFFASLNFGIFGQGHPSGGVGLAIFTIVVGILGAPVFSLLMPIARYIDSFGANRQMFLNLIACFVWAFLMWFFTPVFGIGGIYAAFLYLLFAFIKSRIAKAVHVSILETWYPNFFKLWTRITLFMVFVVIIAGAVFWMFDVEYPITNV